MNTITTKKFNIQRDSVPQIYRVDSVSSTQDKSLIIWKTARLDWKESYTTKFKLKEALLQVLHSDTLRKEIEYIDNPDLFNLILMENTIYEDNLYSIDLFDFDRRKELKKSSPKGATFINEYKLDNKKRIIEHRQFRNNKLFMVVIYKYL